MKIRNKSRSKSAQAELLAAQERQHEAHMNRKKAFLELYNSNPLNFMPTRKGLNACLSKPDPKKAARSMLNVYLNEGFRFVNIPPTECFVEHVKLSD